MSEPEINILEAARTGARELGGHIADLTMELAAQRAMSQKLQERIAELEKGADDAVKQP